MTTPQPLRLAPSLAPVTRAHANRTAYPAWVDKHCTSYWVRWTRLDNYDRFVDRWPALQDWFDAPLRQRLLDKENCVRGEDPHGGANVIMPYLTYLSLVHRVRLDYLIKVDAHHFRHVPPEFADEHALTTADIQSSPSTVGDRSDH